MTSQNTQTKLFNRKNFILFSIFLMLSLNISLINSAYSKQHDDSNIQNVVLQGDKALSEMLNRHKGKVIYLDFWASWCVPCRKSFPWMNAMQQRYKKDGFAVIAVNLDTEYELAEEFLKDNEATFDVVYDHKGETPKKYGVKGMPTSYLLGRDGKVKVAHTGFFTKKKPQYEAEIQTLLKE
jgi:thiol-disulfide isomerase/thioredoxin